jgi:hypothetical protein
MTQPIDNSITRMAEDTTVVKRSAVPHPGETLQEAATVVATRDHDLIRAWARQHSAEPATGERTSTGPATVEVNDGGARVRFNFPAAAAFRPITWEEWFAIFTRDDLVFVYEPEDAAAAGAYGRRSNAYYRLLPAAEWSDPLR